MKVDAVNADPGVRDIIRQAKRKKKKKNYLRRLKEKPALGDFTCFYNNSKTLRTISGKRVLIYKQ